MPSKLFQSILPFVVILLAVELSEPVRAQPVSTTIVVRAKAKDAKFVGSSMGGVSIVIKNTETGEILASGITRGSTGDTEILMRTPKTRSMKLSTGGAAKFEAEVFLSEPVFATVEARGPLAQKQSQVRASTQLWLIPGKDITGDGILLELPGFSVDVLKPQAHETVTENSVSIKANVVMMCGCPTSPGGLWDSSGYEIKALVKMDGETTGTVELNYTGKTSTFEGSFQPNEKGVYNIIVYAYDPETGNTGLDRTVVVVRGP